MAIFTSVMFVVSVTLTQMLVSQASDFAPFPKPPERNVGTMCAAAECPGGTVCRVVKACSDPGCLPHVECLPCVPEGVDDICNTADYINTVLIGKGKEYKSLLPQFCDPTVNNDVSGCPLGSVCGPSQINKSVGTCCYGKPESLLVSKINNDTRCDPADRCKEECAKGFECKPTISDSGTLSYTCQPIYKPGRCPPIPFSLSNFCENVRVESSCMKDNDCKGDQKCCRTACDGRACLSPVKEEL